MESSSIKEYVNQIKQYPLLSAQEEEKLSALVKKGDKKAKDKLVVSNLRLVVSIAKKYVNCNVDIMDLIQEGNIALITAASRFDESYHTKFSTYAYLWIAQSILRFVRNKAPIICIPHRKEILIRKIKAISNILFQECGKEPTINEISTFMGIPEETVKEILNCTYSITSIDYEYDAESEKTIEDTLSDTSFSPEMEFLENELTENLHTMVNDLPHMEKEVLNYRFNLNKSTTKNTLRAVGRNLGISSETVRQLEIKAMKKLRDSAYSSDYFIS